MHNAEFCKRLFEGYVNCYRTFNILKAHRTPNLTQREMMHFVQLGASLGYFSAIEVPRPGTDDRMDASWWTRSPEDAGELRLHLERETEDNRNRTTIERLLQQPTAAPAPPNLVAILNHLYECGVKEFLVQLRSILPQLQDYQQLLIIAWLGNTPNYSEGATYRTCQSWLCTRTGVLTRTAQAATDNAGAWYLYFPEDSPDWRIEELLSEFRQCPRVA